MFSGRPESRIKRIAVITTLNHNVGDDFIRYGVCHLLASRLSCRLEWTFIHKHSPASLRPGMSWFRNFRFESKISPVVDFLLPLNVDRDPILNCDILVQSGAPVYWCANDSTHCADNEWFGPFINRRYSRVRRDVPFLNLAAGACLAYDDDGTRMFGCAKDMRYVDRLTRAAAVTTVRDPLAAAIVKKASGRDVPILPCTAIFARDHQGVTPRADGYIVFNFMDRGGHYDLGGGRSGTNWKTEFEQVYRHFKRSHRCLLVCHDRKELDSARSIDPAGEVFWSADAAEYLKLYAGAKAALVNRLHAAMALFSFGKPVVAVASDSRALMVGVVGIPHHHVDRVTGPQLIEEIEKGMADGNKAQEASEAIRSRALLDYQKALDCL